MAPTNAVIRLISPCLGICEMTDNEPKHCKGCRRTTQEIGAWRFASMDERIDILIRLYERWQAAGAPPKDDTKAQLLHAEMMERFRLAGF
ncbi:MAG: DUF1289 domain-containing protein [Rhodospirillaceae bacterium]|nr:DUF1289 domain-containing protein [Rhodospirillaceae bacterium]